METSPDPLSTKVLRLEAPPELRDALAQAEARYVEAQTLHQQAAELHETVLGELVEFHRQVSGSALTEIGTARLFELDIKINRTSKTCRAAEDHQTDAQIKCLQAAQRLENSARNEGDRRREQIRLAAEMAKLPKSVPLTERLSKLGKR